MSTAVMAQSTVKIAAEENTAKARAQAQTQALEEIIIRLTGQPNVKEMPGVEGILQRAENWVDEYSYEEEGDDVFFVFGFDEQQLRNELAELGAPLWSENRPELVVWWVKQHRDIVSENQADEPAHEALIQQAERRGVPLRFPRMDSEDRVQVAASDVRGQFFDHIARGTENYRTALALAVVQENDHRLRWFLLNRDQEMESGTLTAEDEAALGAQLATQVANVLGQRFAVASGDMQQLRVVVKGVNSLPQWHQLETILQGQAGVKLAQLVRLNEEELQFDVTYAGDGAQLKQVLLFRSELSSCPEDEGTITLCWY